MSPRRAVGGAWTRFGTARAPSGWRAKPDVFDGRPRLGGREAPERIRGASSPAQPCAWTILTTSAFTTLPPEFFGRLSITNQREGTL